MNTDRRDFIKKSGMVSLGFFGLNMLSLNSCIEEPKLGYGPLGPKEGDILSLPKGFTAKVISQTGDVMSDGFLSPGNHDGMGMFKLPGESMLIIRNHEITPGSFDIGPYGKDNRLIDKMDKHKIYDFADGGKSMCVGGTTTMVYNEKTGQVDREYLSLTGTVRNCSGGITPWNSWISCEETALLKGKGDEELKKDHGYNFEVPASTKIGLADPIPIRAMGRFVHESVAVHPSSGIVYQTEDAGDGLFYRYLPNVFPTKYGDLHKGGKLQCLVINDWKSADTRNWTDLKTDVFPEKQTFDVSWIDLEDVESLQNDLRLRGNKQGAAIFASGEGMAYGTNELFFTASFGGKLNKGQIYRYIPSPYEGQPMEKDSPGKIELFLESKSEDSFRFCDNVTVAPWGDVIICEDNMDARIIGITPNGEAYVIAQNIGYRESEFAGPVFSPSGKTLFVNIQSPGLTLAITGPWSIKRV